MLTTGPDEFEGAEGETEDAVPTFVDASWFRFFMLVMMFSITRAFSAFEALDHATRTASDWVLPPGEEDRVNVTKATNDTVSSKERELSLTHRASNVNGAWSVVAGACQPDSRSL